MRSAAVSADFEVAALPLLEAQTDDRRTEPPHVPSGRRREARRCSASSGLPAWAKSAHKRPHHAPARQPALPAPARRHAEHARDPAHRRADDGEPLLRQPARDGSLPGARSPARGRPDAATTHRIVNSNRDATGQRGLRQHAASPCQLGGEPSQSWNASHESYDNGRNDGFVRASGPVAMRYWDKGDIPVHLLTGQALPDRRALLLLGPRPDLPQPPLLLRRHGLGNDRYRQQHASSPRPPTGRSSTA